MKPGKTVLKRINERFQETFFPIEDSAAICAKCGDRKFWVKGLSGGYFRTLCMRYMVSWDKEKYCYVFTLEYCKHDWRKYDEVRLR